MADLAAALERVAELEEERLAAAAEVARLGLLHAQAAGERDALERELRLYAAEIRRLQYVLADVDVFVDGCPPHDPTRPATWTAQGLRHVLADARRHVQGQGPDGPGAAYPVRLDGWRPGMAHRPPPAPLPPELRELEAGRQVAR